MRTGIVEKIKDVAKAFGITYGVASNWKHMYGMPVMADGRYDLKAIDEWQKANIRPRSNRKTVKKIVFTQQAKRREYLERQKEEDNMRGIFGWEGAD